MSARDAARLTSFIPLHRGEHGEAAPLHRQIYDGVRRAILSNQLLPGTRLPASRALANELGISRTTVLQAYQQLLAEGYLAGRPGSGTFVAHRDGARGQSTGQRDDQRQEALHLSERGGRWLAGARATAPYFPTEPQAGRAFRLGLPALDAFPHEVWGRLLGRRYRSSSHELLAHQQPDGYLPLREAIAAYLGTSRGVRCTAEQVIVVAGSQQALDLAARALLDPGETAWMEDPGYLGARTALLGAGAHIVPVPVRDGAFDLAEAQARSDDARLVYITPSHQFPLGGTMNLARRLELLAWAHQAQAWILEDDYDSEFRYAGRPLAALQGLDEHGRVLYLGTFSKVLSPSLRMGYLVAPPPLVEPFLAARANADVHPPPLEQAVLADFIVQGHFARHVRRMRRLYAERQAALLEEAERHLAGMIRLEPDETGLHLVGWLADGLDERALARRATEEEGIFCYPLSLFDIEPYPRGAVLLGFGAVDASEIGEGVRRLAGVCRRLLSR